ncbi:hypothetical protein RSAG8_06182, partial [Rhizoctonia solani AG-8 WAC10335]
MPPSVTCPTCSKVFPDQRRLKAHRGHKKTCGDAYRREVEGQDRLAYQSTHRVPYDTNRVVGGSRQHAASTRTPNYAPLLETGNSYPPNKLPLAPSAYLPPDLPPHFAPEPLAANLIPPRIPVPVPRPRFVPLPPRKSAPVQQRQFAYAPPPNAPRNNAQPAAQPAPAQNNVTMSQYRLRSYGYAMVEED